MRFGNKWRIELLTLVGAFGIGLVEVEEPEFSGFIVWTTRPNVSIMSNHILLLVPRGKRVRRHDKRVGMSLTKPEVFSSESAEYEIPSITSSIEVSQLVSFGHSSALYP